VLGFRDGRDAAAGIRALREAAELSQPQFARQLGRKTGWLRQREWGSIRLTQCEAEQAAAALGTAYPELLAAGAREITRAAAAGAP
jgi:transcriptional regulator with XRE-family HTH domain